jgi:hypothetical protein
MKMFDQNANKEVAQELQYKQKFMNIDPDLANARTSIGDQIQ